MRNRTVFPVLLRIWLNPKKKQKFTYICIKVKTMVLQDNDVKMGYLRIKKNINIITITRALEYNAVFCFPKYQEHSNEIRHPGKASKYTLHV